MILDSFEHRLVLNHGVVVYFAEKWLRAGNQPLVEITAKFPIHSEERSIMRETNAVIVKIEVFQNESRNISLIVAVNHFVQTSFELCQLLCGYSLSTESTGCWFNAGAAFAPFHYVTSRIASPYGRIAAEFAYLADVLYIAAALRTSFQNAIMSENVNRFF